MDAIDLSLLGERLLQIAAQMDLVANRGGSGRAQRVHSICDSSGRVLVGSSACAEALSTSDYRHSVSCDGREVLAIQVGGPAPSDPGGEAALTRGVELLCRLVRAWGADYFQVACAALHARADAAATDALAVLPKGHWNAEDWLDSDGEIDEAVKIGIDLSIDTGTLFLDFGRTSAVRVGAVNLTEALTRAAGLLALHHALPAMPRHTASVAIGIPPDSMLAAGPIDAHGHTFQRVVDVVGAVLAKALPDGALDAASAPVSRIVIDAVGTKEPAVMTFAGGNGARPRHDGSDGGAASSSLEAIESAWPVMFVLSEIRRDSGGAGRWRGGVGTTHEMELLSAQADVSLVGERGKYGPPGLAGGRAGAPLRMAWWDGGVACDPPMISRLQSLTIRQTQRIRLDTPGGGGRGRARLRPAEEIARDVRNGYVSTSAARRDYGVEVDTRGVVDAEATRKLRGSS